jgi:UDP-sulfoquinovose synthase
MKVLILGGDGYLGWPTAMNLAASGCDVCVADNYMRRTIAEATESMPLVECPLLSERTKIFENITGFKIITKICDLSKPRVMFDLVRDFMPDTIIHYAEQPSAPYSMKSFDEAHETFHNNLGVTFNCIWAVKEIVPNCHIVKLGTMGEYGTPNIDIEEGWLEIEHKGRKDKFLFPRAASSLYHTTKVLDTDLLWFYVRTYGLRVTDLMQGPVYGLSTNESDLDPKLLPNFNYDDIFGTLVNRFLVQAVAGVPLTVYGGGGQTRGYLNLRDTLQCVRLAAENPAANGELKIYNQLTETFTVNEVAERISTVGNNMGLDVTIKSIKNPRREKEEHYYNPAHSGLKKLGLKPHPMTDEVIENMLRIVLKHRDRICVEQILPRVRWNK